MHRAVLHNGEKVAVKVQRPGLKKLFDIDLSKRLLFLLPVNWLFYFLHVKHSIIKTKRLHLLIGVGYNNLTYS